MLALIIKALLVALVIGVVKLCDHGLGQPLVERPLVCGLLVGLVLGGLRQGIILGGYLELVFLGTITIGGAVPADLAVGSVLATAFTILLGKDRTVAVALAVPISLLANYVYLLLKLLCTSMVERFDYLLDQKNDKAALRIHSGLTLSYGVIFAVIVFFAIVLGTDAIQALVNAIPASIMAALKTVGNTLPVLGFAILLKALWQRSIAGFFFIGFVAAAYLQLPLLAIAGIWAPSLTYDHGVFYLLYTVAHQIDGIFKDVQNYLMTTEQVEGKWSKPVAINASGFDPSLFHDDGKKYVLNPLWDYRTGKGHVKFSGLLLQEFSPQEQRLIGEKKIIFKGSALGGTEGPHLMKKDGLYYIIAAEGGTGRHHSITVARSARIDGPYQISPYHPLITSYHEPENPLHKAGHGNMVEFNGQWYLVHLCARYLDHKEVSPLGRETAIQNIEWIDGWPKLVGDSNAPRAYYETSVQTPQQETLARYETHFREEKLDTGWMSLRRPAHFVTLYPETGTCRLRGGESLSSLFEQSLIARKVTSFDYAAQATLRFGPKSYLEMAGLVLYYNTKVWIYLYVSHDERAGRRILNILVNDNLQFSEPLGSAYIYLPDTVQDISLRAEAHQEDLQFSYAFDGQNFQKIGPALDLSILSDEHAQGWAYTGTVVGLNAIDLDIKKAFADYRSFQQVELPARSVR